jgi:hypothetical protein
MTDTMTDTATFGPTYLIVTNTVTVCVLRADWVPYIVQPGDTLFRISLRARVTVGELQAANCLLGTNIYYGQVLVVPPGTTIPTPGTDVPSNMTACANPAQTITAPAPGAILRGTVAIQGTANIPKFSFYKLEIRGDKSATWNNFTQRTTPVTNGALGTLNTTLFAPGNYWIQLTAIDTTGNYPLLPCAIAVQISR